jgi:hypothetical protein
MFTLVEVVVCTENCATLDNIAKGATEEVPLAIAYF